MKKLVAIVLIWTAVVLLGVGGTHLLAGEQPFFQAARSTLAQPSAFAGMPYRMFQLAQELGLSEAQRQAIYDVIDGVLPRAREQLFTLFSNHEQLRSMTKEGKFEEDEVRGVADAQAAIIADLIIVAIKAKHEVYGILTAQQRTLLEQRLDSLRGGYAGGMHWPYRMFKIAQDLGITAQQRQQIYGLIDQIRPQVREYVYTLFVNHERLRAATRDHFDEAEVRAIADAQGAIISDLIVLAMRAKAGIYAILTPEQRTQLDQHLAQMFGARAAPR
ncbi:MAG: Spy/CpxP family protein refolding chaperone [Acidiferrobacterales bacterium]